MMRDFERELMVQLGYHLYCFRTDNCLTEKEMISLIRALMNTKQFKKEYGMEE